MVLRKSLSGGAPIPASLMHPPPPLLHLSPTSSDMSEEVLNSTQGPPSESHSQSGPGITGLVESHQQLDIENGSSRRCRAQEEHPALKPVPTIPHAGGPSRRVEELHYQPPSIERPNYAVRNEDTPRSSLDSERWAESWEEGTQDTGLAHDRTQHLQQSEGKIELKGDLANDPTPWRPQGTDVQVLANPPVAPHTTNPFRRGNSSSVFPTGVRRPSGNSRKKQDMDELRPRVDLDQTSFGTTEQLFFSNPSKDSKSYCPSVLTPGGGSYDRGTDGKGDDALVCVAQPPQSSPSLSTPEDITFQKPPVSKDCPTVDSGNPKPRPLASRLLNRAISDLTENNAEDQALESDVGPDLEKASYFAPRGMMAVPADPGVSPPPSSPPQYADPEATKLLNLPVRPLPDTEPPARAVEDEIRRIKEQREGLYDIKHFSWRDHKSRTLRRSSMLTQNQNGPCPLLALVNALILGVEDDSQSPLGAALRTREHVSLGLIIESLMDELMSEGRGDEMTELPDVDELNRFLLMLHSGMTANPRLAVPATPCPNLMDAKNSLLHLPLGINDDRRPGTFEDTCAMRLYGAFGIPLVHGWLAPRSDPARAAFTRSAQTYEDAQTIQFREEELEDKLSRVGLSAEEQQLLQDISSIKSFLESYPTQISPHGLDTINESLFPGAFAILFRNDHFSTIYKHPESGQLFTLVTDAGYFDKDEVIWESLVDVSGQDSGFFSGDFRPIGNVEAGGGHNAQTHHPDRPAAILESQDVVAMSQQELHPPASPQDLQQQQQQQQQADADFAMALQLQEEEEARMDSSRRRSTNDETASHNNQGGVMTMNGQRRSEREGSTNNIRPSIPPRNPRSQGGVNRPVDANPDEAPPPAYEEAAKGKPYVPPLGHPQHPSFHGPSSPRVVSAASSTPHTHSSSSSSSGTRAGPAAPRPPTRRRISAFEESSQYHQGSSSGGISPSLSTAPTHNGGSFGSGVGPHSSRPTRERDKDCRIM